MRTGILALWALAACKGATDSGTNDAILPPGDTDTDTTVDTDVATDTDTDTDPDVTVEDRCAPLPDVGGTMVALTDDLAAMIDAAAPGDTLLLADGTFEVEAPIVIDKALTIRSASGDREAAIVDADDSGTDLFVV